MYAINAKRKLYQLQYLHLLRRLVNMLPAKKPSLSPATQVLAPSFKPTPYNPTSQTPANAFFKLTGPHPPPLKHPQHLLMPLLLWAFWNLRFTTQTTTITTNTFLTQLPSSVSSKFYFERFPSWLDYHDLKKAFSNIGPVTNLFVSKKKTSGGRRFGFVTFLSPLKELDLCDNLNLIWFDSFKIRAKPARFQIPQDSGKKNGPHRKTRNQNHAQTNL